MAHTITRCKVTTSPAPDHRAIIIQIENNHAKRGPGYWKLNATVLNENEYVEGIENIFERERNYASKHGIPKGIIWDMMKIKFKEFSQSYCKQKKQQQKNKIYLIETKIARTEVEISNASHPALGLLHIKRDQLINEMKIELKLQLQASQVRSRVLWTEQGESNTAYFLGLEKSRQKHNTIEKVRKDDDYTENDSETLEEIKQFYENLYETKQSEDHKHSEFLDDITLTHTLSSDQSSLCEGSITLLECTKVINNMKINKSMGLDGLSVEFYKQFWGVIGVFLVNMYNDLFEQGELTESQKISVITLIYKKGDKYLLKNYRPISLSNTDYKIIAQVLANRLHQVLPSMISHEQSGYVKNRLIGHNIRIVEDILYFTKKQNIDSIITLLDFEKAFDSIEWNFIFNV